MSRCPFLLLVEDSDDDAFFFSWAMRKSGLACEVNHIVNGDEALEYLKAAREGRERKPDLVFLDLKLPGRSGFDVLRWARESGANDDFQVVILSGSEHSNDLNMARLLGAASYIVKPVAPDQLRATVGASTNASAEPAESRSLCAAR